MLFVVDGVKMVDELLHSGLEIVEVFATKDWKGFTELPGHNATEVAGHANTYAVREVADWELARLSNLTTPNKVVAVAKIPQQRKPADPQNGLVLMLDKIGDPGNMGTIIRTAEWLGIQHILASNDSVDFYNPKVVQASMGSVFRMQMHFTDILEYLQKSSGFPVYGTLLNGTSIYDAKLSRTGVIVIGNESNGISTQVQEYVTHKITIPAAPGSHAESLNASVATAIICYEFRRQNANFA